MNTLVHKKFVFWKIFKLKDFSINCCYFYKVILSKYISIHHIIIKTLVEYNHFKKYKVLNILKARLYRNINSWKDDSPDNKILKSKLITMRCQEYLISYLTRNRLFHFLSNELTEKLHLFKTFKFFKMKQHIFCEVNWFLLTIIH